MANVYVEPRPKGRPTGTPIEDYAVEDRAHAVLHVTGTQRDAVDWAWANGHSPLVARVRHTDKGNVLHWRSAR
jgi:hypothetical protein